MLSFAAVAFIIIALRVVTFWWEKQMYNQIMAQDAHILWKEYPSRMLWASRTGMPTLFGRTRLPALLLIPPHTRL